MARGMAAPAGQREPAGRVGETAELARPDAFMCWDGVAAACERPTGDLVAEGTVTALDPSPRPHADDAAPNPSDTARLEAAAFARAAREAGAGLAADGSAPAQTRAAPQSRAGDDGSFRGRTLRVMRPRERPLGSPLSAADPRMPPGADCEEAAPVPPLPERSGAQPPRKLWEGCRAHVACPGRPPT